MYTYKYFAALSLLALQLLFSACSATPDRLQREFCGDNRTLTYGQAFTFGLQNGVWSEYKDAKGGPVVQFKGSISTGLHDYALGKLLKEGDRSTFRFACAYLGNLVKTGKVTGDSDITFNIADYPITKTGDVKSDSIEDYLSSPDNRAKIRKLNIFYMNRYWAEGSDCIIQWRYSGKGAPEVVKISNKHWDNDAIYSQNPDTVTQMIVDYAASMSN